MSLAVNQSIEKPSVFPRLLAIFGLLFVFLVGVRGLGGGFRLLGEDLIQSFFTATENPFMGLLVGLLATTVVQSSSVTTAMIVGLVAAPENPLPLLNAVPMVMGANIGTTVTATIVALGHIGRREEFERAFPVAICHDVFNYIAVLVLLPLEMFTGFLQSTAGWFTGFLGGFGGVVYRSPLRTLLGYGLVPISAVNEALFTTEGSQAVFLIMVSGFLIFGALFFIVKVMSGAVQSRVESAVNRALGVNAVFSILIGVIVTIMVQSSSITTSLLVPLAGAGLLRLERAFPVTLGANIGTTVTGFLAAMAVTGVNATAGLQIALVHLFFNLSGTLMIYPIPAVRNIPLRISRRITRLAVRSRRLTLVWVGLLFYGLPALAVFFSRML
ncbi:MAG TPA: sodium dependent phosphate transporter [Acidobacteria bacterium]|nr:sodium dependent phosphate transporter [Acidobacteriota bacterium]